MRALVFFSLFACANPAPRAHLTPNGTVVIGPPSSVYTTETPAQPLDAAATCGAQRSGTTFTDVTHAWGLSEVRGNRLSVADLDNDGYPDLVISSSAPNRRSALALPDGGSQLLVRQLMNRPAPSGAGRVFVDETLAGGLFTTRDDAEAALRSVQLTIFGDVDNDGDLDALTGTFVDPAQPATDPGDRTEVMLNDGTGHFSLGEPSDVRPSAQQRWPTSGAAFTDYDLDGHLDVFTGNWYENYGASYFGVQARLYRGAGGTFTDVTSQAGLTTLRTTESLADFTNHRPAYGVTACDVNGDGAPELLVSAYGRQANLLYRNNRDGTFTDESAASGFAGDGDLDYRDNENFKCWCTVHTAEPDCAGVAAPNVQCGAPADGAWPRGTDDQPWRNNGNTFSTWCGDVDGDGLNELYSAEIRHWWAGSASDSSELLRNVSTGAEVRFSRPGNAATGLAPPRVGGSWNEGGIMAAGGDLDNDGRVDLLLAESDYPDQFGELFAQQADGRFERVRAAWNLSHPCMSGLAIADFDRDGDLDVLAGAGTARDCAQQWRFGNEVRLYENQATDSGWLLLHLAGDGVATNRAAIGARVTVKAGGRTMTREVSGGYGHFGQQNDVTLHVGLGACDGADEVTVRWPDARGSTQTFARVKGNQFLHLEQGAATPFVVTPR